jgi:hypothetical protein
MQLQIQNAMSGRLLGIAMILFVLSVSYSEETPAQATRSIQRSAHARQASQQTFPTPEAATQALADAVRGNDSRKMQATLGPGSGRLIRSGDPVEDERGRARFLAAYQEAVKIERDRDGSARVFLGSNEWPLPFPLVHTAAGWRFDARSGAKEILSRRIGRNELSAVQVCLAYVDAQREYVLKDRDNDGVLEYAQELISAPGKRNGLYWQTAQGESASPLGPLVGKARSEGYGDAQGDTAQPYHGYLFKILTAQGPRAAGGAYDYIIDGRMIGGFALVAWPARWRASGVMTFIVNHDGVVYSKNLGPQTPAIVERMALFGPDATWTKEPATPGH